MVRPNLRIVSSEQLTNATLAFSFEHAITGMRSLSVSDETGGGILADDMGLGKTLTCLATIIRTAQIATRFWESGRELQEKQGDVTQA